MQHTAARAGALKAGSPDRATAWPLSVPGQAQQSTDAGCNEVMSLCLRPLGRDRTTGPPGRRWAILQPAVTVPAGLNEALTFRRASRPSH